MSDQPQSVVTHDADRPTDQESATNRRPTTPRCHSWKRLGKALETGLIASTEAQTMPQERAVAMERDEHPGVVSETLINRLRRLLGR
jgi:hypothetical protein